MTYSEGLFIKKKDVRQDESQPVPQESECLVPSRWFPSKRATSSLLLRSVHHSYSLLMHLIMVERPPASFDLSSGRTKKPNSRLCRK